MFVKASRVRQILAQEAEAMKNRTQKLHVIICLLAKNGLLRQGRQRLNVHRRQMIAR